jgi:CheY-like chemotaxis protein
VLAAFDEDEAVRLLGEHHSEIVAALVGSGAPDPGGLLLPARLREVRRDLPMVVLSGLPEPEVRPLVEISTAVRFLRWPCARDDLVGALRELLTLPGPA